MAQSQGGAFRRMAVVFVGLVTTASVGACKSFIDSAFPPTEQVTTAQFDPSLGIDLSKFTVTSDGLYYQDVVVGNGATVQIPDTVKVDYTAWLSDATQVDAGSGVLLPLGTGQIIPGLEEGLLGMNVGGERKLIVPSSLAYGSQGYGPIPGGRLLVFDVQVLAIQGQAP